MLIQLTQEQIDQVRAGKEPSGLDPAAYADGWSIEMRHGCVTNKRVDEWLLAHGNQPPRWFSVFLPDREYDEATRKLMDRNYKQHHNSLTYISGQQGTTVYGDFYPEVTRKESDKRPPFSYVYGEPLDGFYTPVAGFDPYTVYMTVADTYIRRLEEGQFSYVDPTHRPSG